MTIQTRSALKAVFEQGDTPAGSDFADLIDSSLNLADTTAQSITSDVTFGGAVSFSGGVSAASMTIGGIVSAQKIVVVTAEVGLVEATTVAASFVSGSVVNAGELFINLQRVEGLGANPEAIIWVAASASTPISAAGAYQNVVASAWATDISINQNMSANLTTGTLEFTGTAARNFLMMGCFSVISTANSQLTASVFGRNDAPVTASEIERFIGTGADTGAVSMCHLVSANPGDRFSIMLTNKTGTARLIAKRLNLVVRAL